MKWAWTICKVFGIRIRLHITFLLLVLWVMAEAYGEAGGEGAFWGLMFVLCAFGCVAIHELGHSVAAQRLGVQVGAITLLPIGGVAALRSIPERPIHEIAITVAGPAMNVIIFGVLYLVGHWVPFLVPYYGGLMLLPGLPMGLGELIGALLVINKWMVLFNLIPAYPMDGGRLLRATLAALLPYPRATTIAAVVGRAIAVVFVVGGLFFLQYFILAVIGVLIYLAAGSEVRNIQLRNLLRDVAVSSVMNPDFSRVGPDATAGECLRRIYQTGQDDFPVMVDGQMVGLLTRDVVLRAMRQGGGGTRAGDLMETGFLTVPSDALTDQAHEQMLESGQQTLPVIRDGHLVGLLTRDNIQRYFLLTSALGGRGGRK